MSDLERAVEEPPTIIVNVNMCGPDRMTTKDKSNQPQIIYSSQNNNENPNSKSRTYFGFTKVQILTIFVFMNSNLFAGTVMSIPSPFYPKEAEMKGATPSEYGFIFGVFHLTMFLTSPIYGSLLGSFSPKLMFASGTFVTGFTTVLFGFLDFVNDRLAFVILSFALRIISAAGQSANIAATFTIIAIEFPESVATTFASLETCFGLGLIVGPSVGGVLYELGGFVLPFIVMGALMMMTGIVSLILLANFKPASHLQQSMEGSTGSKFGFLSLIKIPAVALAAGSICISSSGIGFLNTTLEPHLRKQFNLTPIYTGLMFIVDGGMYAMSAPFWGKVCGSWFAQPKYVTIIGCCLTFIGFHFIGPVPFMPFPSILGVTILGLCIHGLGMGASFVSSFIMGLKDSVAYGFPDSVATYGLVSGMWVSFLALGSFIGPSVGGILLDNFGFEYASLYVLITNIIMVSWTVGFMWLGKPPSVNRQLIKEKAALLPHKNVLIDELSNEIQSKLVSSYGATS